MPKKKNRKKEKNYHLDHLIEAEAEQAAKEVVNRREDKKNEIIQNDIISKKADMLRKNREREQKSINRDVTFSTILTIIFMTALSVIYFFENQNHFMSSLSRDLMDLLMQR